MDPPHTHGEKERRERREKREERRRKFETYEKHTQKKKKKGKEKESSFNTHLVLGEERRKTSKVERGVLRESVLHGDNCLTLVDIVQKRRRRERKRREREK